MVLQNWQELGTLFFAKSAKEHTAVQPKEFNVPQKERKALQVELPQLHRSGSFRASSRAMSSVVPVIVPQGLTDSKVASIVSAAGAAHLVPQAIERIQQEATVFAIVTHWGGCRPCGMSTSSTIQKIGSCAAVGDCDKSVVWFCTRFV